MHMRIRLVLLVAAAAATGALGASGSASADPLCYSASTSGVVTTGVGPVCQGYPYSVSCSTRSAGLSPTFGVTVKFCTP